MSPLKLIFAVCLIGFFGGFIAINRSVFNVTYLNKYLPIKPEDFTELYFVDSSDLPYRIDQGDQKSFRFAIHNRELQTNSYNYQVIQTSATISAQIDQGSVTLRPDETKIIDELIPYLVATKSAIIVSIPSRDQSIDFWLNKGF